MSNFDKFIKLLGIIIATTGAVMALTAGQTNISDYMIATGCLMYLAVKIAEWWKPK
jgi:hypothetical protein